MRAEIRLRVPHMKVRAVDPKGYPIDHNAMRFRKVMDIPGYPRVGEVLSVTTSSARSIRATIAQVELDESRALFVLSCHYASRAISAEDYAALTNDPEWELKHLLE